MTPGAQRVCGYGLSEVGAAADSFHTKDTQIKTILGQRLVQIYLTLA